MLTNVRYILLTALRDWLFAALLIFILTCGLISHTLAGTALIETQEIALSFTSASIKVVVITGLIIFICFHVRNAFDTKEIDVFLSRPITRANLIFSYWIGFAAVALLLLMPTLFMTGIQGVLNWNGFFFWSTSFLVECWFVVTVSLLAAFMLKSAVTSTLASMGFYVFARMMGFFIATAQTRSYADTQVAHNQSLYYALKCISLIIPRLDQFAQSNWLIYGVRDLGHYQLFALQAVIYIHLLLFATILDFRRKEF